MERPDARRHHRPRPAAATGRRAAPTDANGSGIASGSSTVPRSSRSGCSAWSTSRSGISRAERSGFRCTVFSARSARASRPTPRRPRSRRSRSTSTSPTNVWSSGSRRSSCTPGETLELTRYSASASVRTSATGIDLMYDGSAGFDLTDAIYLGRALSEAGYRWYEEPMREFSVTAYRWLSERVDVPLLVGETSDGSHLNTADFIASGCATSVRTSANHRGGMTGAMRIAHLADSFQLRAEVHGPTETAVHLCMAIPNCTYYESLVTSNPVVRESRASGPTDWCRHRQRPGIALPALRRGAPTSRRCDHSSSNENDALPRRTCRRRDDLQINTRVGGERSNHEVFQRPTGAGDPGTRWARAALAADSRCGTGTALAVPAASAKIRAHKASGTPLGRVVRRRPRGVRQGVQGDSPAREHQVGPV